MPHVNALGRVAHGRGSMGAFLDNALIDAGGEACWLDTWDGATIVYHHGGADGWYVALFDVAAGAMRPAIPDPAHPFHGLGANVLFADGGVWAAWSSDVGLFASTGLHLPYAGLLGVGPDGEIGYRPDYQATGPAHVRERDGADWLLSHGVVTELQLLGAGRALWTEGPDVVRTLNLPPPKVLPGGVWAPRVVRILDAWWLCYYSGSAGVVLHPFDSWLGYVIVPLGQNAWQDAIAMPPDVVRVVWSITEGEGAGDIRLRDVNLTLETPVDLTPIEPPVEPPIEPPIVEPPPIEPVEPPVSEVITMQVALSSPAYLNWRWGGGQSLEPPTNPADTNRAPFEYNRPTAGADEWAELVPQGAYYAVRSPNGRSWLSVQLDGSLEERDAAADPGEWELFTLTDDGCVVEKPKEGVTRPPAEFVV